MTAILTCIVVAVVLADKEKALAYALLFVGTVLAAHWGII